MGYAFKWELYELKDTPASIRLSKPVGKSPKSSGITEPEALGEGAKLHKNCRFLK